MDKPKQYIILKDRHPRISEVLNDCIQLCVPAKQNEPLSSILQKMCSKITANAFTFPSTESILFTKNGTRITSDVRISQDDDNCLEIRSDGLYSDCSGGGGGGISSLNGLTGPTQTFAVGSSGMDFTIASSGTAHTFNIPSASTLNRGLMTTGTQVFAGSKTFLINPIFDAILQDQVPFAGVSGQISANNAFRFILGSLELNIGGRLNFSGDLRPNNLPGTSGQALISQGAGVAPIWTTISSGVTSVAGTSNRVTSTGGTTPVIDISASYAGQASITILGTVVTGIWNGTAIDDAHVSSAATWNAKVSSVTGTSNRITSTGGITPVIDISASYAGQTSITTLGTVISGTWNGSAIGDSFIVSAGTWNAKVGSVTGTANRITSTGGTTPTLDISASYVGQSSIITLGTITSGGLGTGAVIGGVTMTLGSDAANDIYYRNGSGILTRLANGSSGQFLGANTAAAPSWQSPGGGVTSFTDGSGFDGTITGSALALTTTLTQGSVAFIGASGALAEDNTNFFWDDTNNRLGLGINTPLFNLHLNSVSGNPIAAAFFNTAIGSCALNWGLLDSTFNSAQTYFEYAGNGSLNNKVHFGFHGNLLYSLTLKADKTMGVNHASPTAQFHIAAGTATAGTGPLKLTAGTNLSVVEDGTFEFDGTTLYFSLGGVRKTVTLV